MPKNPKKISMPAKDKAFKSKGKNKRKKKSDEKGYHPARDPARRKKTGPRTSIMEFRTTSAKTFIDSAGQSQPLKHSILLDRQKIVVDNHLNEKQFSNTILKQLSNAPFFRPIKTVTDFSTTGSPSKAVTPQKNTQVTCVANFGSFWLFSNNPELQLAKKPCVKKLSMDHPFFNTPEYKALKVVLDNIKQQQITITKASLQKTRDALHKAGNVRAQSQAQVVIKKGESVKNGSAKKYAQASTLFNMTMRWEWLHLIAHKISALQDVSNLVAGSFDANTLMIFFETWMDSLAETYKAGFNLEIVAHLVHASAKKSTHIATKIEYNIVTPDFKLPITFDVQAENTPHSAYKNIIDALMSALLASKKLQPSISHPLAPASFPFFQKLPLPMSGSPAPKSLKTKIK